MTQQMIAVLGAGAMGSAVSQILTIKGGFKVLTYLEGRTESTRVRAGEAGMHDTSLLEIVQSCPIIISVIPPSEALRLAEIVVEAASKKQAGKSPAKKTIYCDMNAIAPDTAKKVAKTVKAHFNFVDGCVIGGPPSNDYQPTIYVSGDDSTAVIDFENAVGHRHDQEVLKVKVLDGQNDGAASALKLSYAGLTKGFTGLAATMLLSAAEHSPETASALLEELSISQPHFAKMISRTIPACLPKAYRFVGEMEEIASYVQSTLDGTAATYTGLAELYQRLADDVRSNGQDSRKLKELAQQIGHS